MIVFSGVRKIYGGRTVLDIEHLELQPGKIHAVLGPNGSGKSTLLKLMAGLEQPDSGQITSKAGNEAGYPTADQRQISYLPQHPYLFDFSVRGNVQLGLEGRSFRDADAVKKAAGGTDWEIGMTAKIDEMLETVGMKTFAGTRANKLSGGEAQRVAVARTLIRPSALILLDEPTSAADIAGMRQVEEAIRTVRQRHGATVVMSTHNPSQAMRLADQVIYLESGKLVESGETGQVLRVPASMELKEFLANWTF